MLRHLFASLVILTSLGAAPALADAKFVAFIETLWPRAKEAGISRELFDRAFAGITEPDPAVLKLAQNQPEFTSTTSQYLEKAVTPARIETGHFHDHFLVHRDRSARRVDQRHLAIRVQSERRQSLSSGSSGPRATFPQVSELA